MSPVERFLRKAPWARGPDADTVARTLAEGLQRATTENPGIPGDLADFGEYIADRLTPGSKALAELESLHFGDLYLAWSLIRGERSAFARFEREHLSKLRGLVKKELLPPPGELEQAVLTRVLVAEQGQEPKIRSYSGRGPLGAWVRMIATRLALDLRRSSQGRRCLAPEPADLPGDPELDFLKQRYAADFSQALEAALAALPHRSATLLKLAFVDGMSAASIGTIYGVSSRTVQRWIAEVRQLVLTRTSEALRARLSLSSRELESLLGLMQSRLYVSLERVLSQQPAELKPDSHGP